MRWIDDIIRAVNEHPNISENHKRVLINRIEKPPTQKEIDRAYRELNRS
jgi:uncharacterized protein YneF (UPF0154 family)